MNEKGSVLRIAYVSYADYGGPLVHTREFVRALSKIVPDLVVCCPYLHKELSYVRPSPETIANRMLANFPLWARQLKLEFYQFRKLLSEFRKRHAYRQLFKESRIDIVIIRHDAFVLGPVWAAVREGVPYVLEVNGVLVKHSPDRVTRWFEKYAFTHAGGIFAVTDSLARLLVDGGASRDKVRVITNGVRLDRFERSKADGVPKPLREKLNNRIVIGYVGTFAAYHDTKVLVDGFALARKEVERLRMVLVGEGRFDGEMKNYVAEKNLQDDIYFTGRVGYDSIPDYLHAFDIAANPVKKIYEEDFHGAPIKMFEYMATGLPVVSTDMPNLKRLLGESVIFVPPDQPEQWGRVFADLAKNESSRRQKGRDAHNYLVENDFTWNGNAKRVQDFCSDVLNQRDNRGNGP